MTNELVTSYLAWHPDTKKQLKRLVYPDLLQLVEGLEARQGQRSIATPEYVIAMIANRMLLLGDSPTHVTGSQLTQNPDQNVFDYDIENPFWSDQRVYGLFVSITAVIGEQPASTVTEFFRYLSALAIRQVKLKSHS